MVQLNPYLTFNGNCREAMTFYKECFGGELTFMSVDESPIASQCPAGMQHHIMHSMLTADKNFILMATDMTGPKGITMGNDVSLSLHFDDPEKINEYFSKLSAEGNIIDPLKEQFWGDLFGVVQDKFGKVWMMNCELKK